MEKRRWAGPTATPPSPAPGHLPDRLPRYGSGSHRRDDGRQEGHENRDGPRRSHLSGSVVSGGLERSGIGLGLPRMRPGQELQLGPGDPEHQGPQQQPLRRGGSTVRGDDPDARRRRIPAAAAADGGVGDRLVPEGGSYRRQQCGIRRLRRPGGGAGRPAAGGRTQLLHHQAGAVGPHRNRRRRNRQRLEPGGRYPRAAVGSRLQAPQT